MCWLLPWSNITFFIIKFITILYKKHSKNIMVFKIFYFKLEWLFICALCAELSCALCFVCHRCEPFVTIKVWMKKKGYGTKKYVTIANSIGVQITASQKLVASYYFENRCDITFCLAGWISHHWLLCAETVLLRKRHTLVRVCHVKTKLTCSIEMFLSFSVSGVWHRTSEFQKLFPLLTFA